MYIINTKLSVSLTSSLGILKVALVQNLMKIFNAKFKKFIKENSWNNFFKNLKICKLFHQIFLVNLAI